MFSWPATRTRRPGRGVPAITARAPEGDIASVCDSGMRSRIDPQ